MSLGSPPPPPPPAGPSGALRSLGASRSLQVPPPPPPPPSTNQEGQSKGSATPSSLKTAASAEYQAWTKTDTRLRPHWECPYSKGELATRLWKPLEEERPATSEPAWSISSSDVPVPKNNWASALASTYSPPPEDSLLAQTGDIAMFMDWFSWTNQSSDLEYLRYGSKGSRHALLISKMKAAYYPDIGLEQMVPDQMWIKEECKYDIAAMYGISHWWFQRHRFYIDIHTSEGDCKAVRTHMRILSVVRIEVFSMYGYDYMKKIVLRCADLNEHVITERDFKYLYPSDFKDLYMLNLQGHQNHLPPKDKKIPTTAVNLWTRHLVIRQQVEDFQLGIESYQTHLNLTKPRWDATGFEYKHDYTVIDSLRVVTFRDRYGVQMFMRFNEIHNHVFIIDRYLHVCYTDSEPWRFRWVSDEEPEAPEEAPPSPDYVPGLEHPPSPDYVPGPEHPPLPDYVPELEYPEYLAPSDAEVPIEDQPLPDKPLPDNASPTTLSPGYVVDSDPKEDPVNGGDDNDESFGDDFDDEDEEASKEVDDEKEEHLALADSDRLPIVDPVPSAEDIEAFETDESALTPPSPKLRRARIYV
nr:hypothetical protein [Tanacetum cinerariifolium]